MKTYLTVLLVTSSLQASAMDLGEVISLKECEITETNGELYVGVESEKTIQEVITIKCMAGVSNPNQFCQQQQQQHAQMQPRRVYERPEQVFSIHKTNKISANYTLPHGEHLQIGETLYKCGENL